MNAGFGLWQLAYGSRNTLDPANDAFVRAAMLDFRTDEGRILGVKPSIMVVPPALESAAPHLLDTETNDGGGLNPWKGTVELIVTPWVN